MNIDTSASLVLVLLELCFINMNSVKAEKNVDSIYSLSFFIFNLLKH